MTTPNGAPIDRVKASVLNVAKAMYAKGLVEGTAGNVSGRVDDGTVVMTPSSLGYEEMTLDDLVVVALDGSVVAGHRSATSELGVHLTALAAYPEVGGVVLPRPYASMYAVAHRPIPAAIDEFVVYIGGDVPCGAYHQSGSDDLATEVATHLAARSAMLMANHGLVAIGKSVEDALHSASVVEHNARIMWGAQQLGAVVALPDRAVRDFTDVYRYLRGQTWSPAPAGADEST